LIPSRRSHDFCQFFCQYLFKTFQDERIFKLAKKPASFPIVY